MAEYKSDDDIKTKLWVKNVALVGLDLNELKMELNSKASEDRINRCSNACFVLDARIEAHYCYIYFIDEHDCSYGLFLQGTKHQGIELDICRPQDYEFPQLGEPLSWFRCNGLEPDPYICEKRSYRIVHFDLSPKQIQTLEQNFEVDMLNCLNNFMNEMNMGCFAKSIDPVLYARFNEGKPFVEMRSREAAVNVLNLNYFPFRDFKICILVPSRLQSCNFFTYDELNGLQDNQRFKLLSMGPFSTVVTVLLYYSKDLDAVTDLIREFWVTPDVCSIRRSDRFDDSVHYYDIEMSLLFVEMRTVISTLKMVDFLKLNLCNESTIRFFDERKFHCMHWKEKDVVFENLVLIKDKDTFEEPTDESIVLTSLNDVISWCWSQK